MTDSEADFTSLRRSAACAQLSRQQISELIGGSPPPCSTSANASGKRWSVYLHVRNTAAQVTSMAVVVATGITATGEREVLGLDVGDSEDEVFWRQFLRSLKSHGLSGMRLVISDQHAGLVAALKRSFQGSTHQRCRVHFSRNLLALVPKSHKDMVAAVFRTIFAQPDPDTAAATWDDVRSHPHRRVALGDACLVPLDRGQSDARRSRRQRTFTQLQWPRPTDRHGRFGTT